MTADNPNPARVKGGKVSAAKKLAKSSSQDQLLSEYNLLVRADGSVIDYSSGAAEFLSEAAVSELEAAAAPVADPMEAELVDQLKDPAAFGLGPPPAPGPMLPAGPPVTVEPVGEASFATEFTRLVELGLSPQEATTLARAKFPPAPIPGAPPKEAIEQRLLEQDRAIQGPDPAQLAAYQEHMRNYTPPQLSRDVTVTLQNRFADYVERWAKMETVKRGREVTVEDAVQMIIRQYWLTDPLRALLEGTTGHSGPASAFNPATGTWG